MGHVGLWDLGTNKDTRDKTAKTKTMPHDTYTSLVLNANTQCGIRHNGTIRTFAMPYIVSRHIFLTVLTAVVDSTYRACAFLNLRVLGCGCMQRAVVACGILARKIEPSVIHSPG